MPPLPQRYQPHRYEEEDDAVPLRRRIWKWLLLLAIPLVLWQGWRMVSASRQLAKVRTLQSQMANAKDMKPEERQSLFKDMRSAMNNLTPAQKKMLATEQQNKRIQELKSYVAMSKAEQKKYLDARINQMQQMMNAFNGANPAGQNKGPNGQFAAGQSGGRNGSGSSKSPEEIEHAKRERLDNSSPEFRALNDRFRNDLAQRMRERGMQPPQRRGG